MTKLTVTATVVVLIAISLGASGLPLASQPDETESTASIRRTLDEQVKAWNAGDIPGFMGGYVRGEELRFASGGKVQNGWQNTLERYQAKYSSRELMGTLEFSELQILVLSSDYAEVFGRFTLTRDKSVGNATGLFTLLMQRDGDRWLVRHDHTSSAE